ncbi:MAG: D-alanyl-D-alanine carboxypeptidase [Oscillospiraceae bacterium]|nr:D-alanyl-D-alanine carboxypeptidase [Oscillospiraceae bacterium]
MKNFKKLALILILCIVFAALSPAAYASPAPSLNGKNIVLADANMGRIVYEKNMNEEVAPASLTKIMTVLLAIEAVEKGDHAFDEIVTAKDDCRTGLDEESSSGEIQPGEQMSYLDLIHCSMVQSASDACNVLASLLGGSIDAFVTMMNDRARELGCTVTQFADPNGLSNSNRTTAYEMFLITQEAVSHDYFMAVANVADVTISATNMHEAREYHNSNSLISSQSYYGGSKYLYPGAAGVKTGYTRAAGYCLISTAEKENLRFVAVVMGCDGWLNAGIEDYMNFEDTIALYDWAFGNFEYQTVVSSSEPMAELDVKYAEDNAKAVLYPQSNLRILMDKDTKDDDVTTEITFYETDLVAPVGAGEVLGEARILVNGEEYATISLATKQAVALAHSVYMRQQLKVFFSNRVVIGILAVLLVILAMYITLQVKYRKARKEFYQKRLEQERRQRQRQRELEEKRRAGWDLEE